MKFEGLVLQTEAFEFNSHLHTTDIGAGAGAIDLDIKAKVHSGQIVTDMDMQYYLKADPLTPLASLRTSAKLRVSPILPDLYCSEQILFCLKMQHRYCSFILYQKLAPMNLEQFYIPTPPDEQLFAAIKSEHMTDLQFDERGNYTINFSLHF